MRKASSWVLSLLMVLTLVCGIMAPAFAADADVPETSGGVSDTTPGEESPPEGIPFDADVYQGVSNGVDTAQPASNIPAEYMPIYVNLRMNDTEYQVASGVEFHMYGKDGKEYPTVSKSDFIRTDTGDYISSIVLAAPLDSKEDAVTLLVTGGGVTGKYQIRASSWELGKDSDEVNLYLPKETEDSDDYSLGFATESHLDVTFSIKEAPIITETFMLYGTSTTVGGLQIKVADVKNDTSFTRNTTSGGKLYLSASPSGYWQLTIINDGYTFTNGLNVMDISASVADTGATPTVYLKSTKMTDNVIGKLTVNTTAEGYKYVSPSWGSYTLNLEKDGVVRQLQCGIGETVMPQIEPGDYTLSVENDEACNVTVPTTLHIGDEGYIEASVTPKYTMEVTKSVNGKQKNYEFQFADYENLGTYKGHDATIFAVAPYEVYSLKDISTDRSVQASISPLEFVTKVALSRDEIARSIPPRNGATDGSSKGRNPESPPQTSPALDQTPVVTLNFLLSDTELSIRYLPVTITDVESGMTVTKQTTESGELYLDASPSGYWQLSLPNAEYTFEDGSTIQDIPADEASTGSNLEIYLVSTITETGDSIGKLYVNTTASTDYKYVSPSWGSYTLNLEKDGVIRQLQCGIGETVMPEIEPGDYNVFVESSDICSVIVPNILHVGNEGYLEAAVTPKYTMEVTKSVNGKQQNYEFQFVDYEDLGTYTGYDATIFAVSPYDMYTLQDISTECSVQVSINPQDYVTKVVLGRGPITGGDVFMYFAWGMLGLAVLLAIGIFVYKKKLGKQGTRVLSLFLAITLVGGMLVPFQSASAEGGGSQTGGTDSDGYTGGVPQPTSPYYRTPTGGTPANAGVLRLTFMFESKEGETPQTSGLYSQELLANMSRIKFMLGQDHITTGTSMPTWDAGASPAGFAVGTLADRAKFWDRTLEFYLPLNDSTMDDWSSSNTGVWRANDGAAEILEKANLAHNLSKGQSTNYWDWLQIAEADKLVDYPNYGWRGARTLPSINSRYANSAHYEDDLFMQLLTQAFSGKKVGETDLGTKFKSVFEDNLCCSDTDSQAKKDQVEANRKQFAESLIMHLWTILYSNSSSPTNGKFTSPSGIDCHTYVADDWYDTNWGESKHERYLRGDLTFLPEELKYLNDKILAGEAAIVIEECVRFEYTGNQTQFDNSDYAEYGYKKVMYAPVSVLTYMLAQCSQNTSNLPGQYIKHGDEQYPINFEARAMDDSHKGWGCNGSKCGKAACEMYGHVAYTGRAALNHMYTQTLRPVVGSQYLSDGRDEQVSDKNYSSDTKGNWFGGWGYALISGGDGTGAAQPQIDAEVVYQLEDGTVIQTDTTSYPKQNILKLQPNAPSALTGKPTESDIKNQIPIQSVVTSGSMKYKAEAILSTTAKATVDGRCLEHGVVDTCNLYSVADESAMPPYVGVFREILQGCGREITPVTKLPVQNSSLAFYLGGDDQAELIAPVYNAIKTGESTKLIPGQQKLLYEILKSTDPTEIRAYGTDTAVGQKSDAHVVVTVLVREVAPVDVKDIVPEWRLTKRWNSIQDFVGGSKDVMFSNFTISPSGGHDGCYHSSVSGGISIDQVTQPGTLTQRGAMETFTKVPDMTPANTLWATAVIKSYESVGESKNTATSVLDQRTLAVKEQGSPVGQIHVTNWVPDGANRDFLDEVGIPSDIKGVSMTGNTSQSYEYIPEYHIANGNNVISHTASTYSHGPFGECYCSNNYETLANVFQFSLSTAAKAKVTLTYNRYIPKDMPTSTYSSYATSVNGKTSVSAQSSAKLRLWPEVPMLYTTKQAGYADLPGITGVVYAAGAKERQLSPVSWHTLDYDAYVTPKAVGTATATDARAVATWHDTKTPVIYKGAGVNMSFDLKLKKDSEKSATLTTKSYILDVGNTAIKNAWGNGAYSPANINDDFLKTFAEQKDGKWTVKATGIENLKVNGVPDVQLKSTFAQVKNDLLYLENNRSSTEYPIVVRGGLLAYVYIGGTAYSPAEVKGVDKELYDALVGMHLINEDAAKSYETVFSCFEHFGGAIADEALYVSKVNTQRHGGQPWSASKDKGWYNEDSTVLTIRVYTTVFDLPASVFADKLPMTVKTSNNSLETPIDKNQFFSKIEQGFSVLRYTFDANLNPYTQSDVATKTSVYMEHDSKVGGEFGDKAVDYGVPNVSILDTTNLG